MRKAILLFAALATDAAADTKSKLDKHLENPFNTDVLLSECEGLYRGMAKILKMGGALNSVEQF